MKTRTFRIDFEFHTDHDRETVERVAKEHAAKLSAVFENVVTAVQQGAERGRRDAG